ncbi:MAG: ATP-binding protein [Muribaculaceae bacterium]
MENSQFKIFRRKVYQDMLQWKQQSNGKTALLIKGARRIGKSTIAQVFAKNEYKTFIAIDFAKAAKTIQELFDDLSDLNYIFTHLQSEYGVHLYPRQSVIIFDEVQKCPNARQAIKYLVADGRFDYIETGSLISIRQNIQNIIIPSEETQITMHPMDFEEFLWARGDELRMDIVRYAFDKNRPLGENAHRKMMRDFRLYMIVGGMPQSVETYLTTNNLEACDSTKRSILNLYEEDLRKCDPSGRASRIFRSIPSELYRNTSRYHVSSVIENARVERLTEVWQDLEESLIVNFAYHCTDPNVGLSLKVNMDCFKLFMADTGLFVTMAFNDKKTTDGSIYNKLLADHLSIDLGYVYENIVAQMLRAAGNNLFYYTFPKDNSHHNYEIDFLIVRNQKVCPIEVKSGNFRSHASIDAFISKYHQRIHCPYLLTCKDLAQKEQIRVLPIYMTGLL